ncbi:Protein kinase C signaling pathway involved MAPKK protein [Kickxella alabastrina]|uniref:Protein kinase C signaling pathway involved MAPKK protein n=1 Tax=Kickxella alabastrina TaxID=61397 RepID=A0ACC1IFT7_9FUNG|nr:Protein kinase C signaling pathway involved MAPKK protein [Kickxella alabastrina]
MTSSLNRSNATSNRTTQRPLIPRLYTPTTPRGQPPLLLQIPRQQQQQQQPSIIIPQIQTNNLPLTNGGDLAARQQSRETHLGLSIITSRAGSTGVPTGGRLPPVGTPALAPAPAPALQAAAAGLTLLTGSAISQPSVGDIAGQLTQLSLSGRTPTITSVLDDTSTSLVSEEEEYALADENIKVMRKLGEGSVGTVHKVEYLPLSKIMARKLITVYPDETHHKQILRELRLLKQCQSPYVVKFYGAYRSVDDDGQSIAICMEYCEGGSLESVYQRVAKLRGQIGEGVLGKVAVAVLNGLVHLHSWQVIHRDVKPSNILVTGRGEIKLCDFGVSGELVDSIAQTFVGTSYYMAPERIQGDRYAVQSDVWSLGLTLIEVSQNQFPFPPPGHPQLSVIELLEYIIHMPVPEMEPLRFSEECCDFVKRCLIKEPSRRPTPSQLLSHPFIVKAAAKKLDLKSWIERVWGVTKK